MKIKEQVNRPASGLTGLEPTTRVQEYEVEDDLVLYDPSMDAAHFLNSTAASVWWLCDGQRSAEEISVRIAELYDLQPDKVVRGVEQIVAGLRQARLLQ